ncbi:hypothetical protein CHS0354_033877 [Potamilus streckersoni]|uniref:Uncharacterized protein n=1 Tax=Potamilus streckersoni TaxID=2493646 RepID=A0AAE0RWZ1_9BIVA|nr:hypothetical protein CHS0354_033877 [Potamilus streckersoni]
MAEDNITMGTNVGTISIRLSAKVQSTDKTKLVEEGIRMRLWSLLSNEQTLKHCHSSGEFKECGCYRNDQHQQISSQSVNSITGCCWRNDTIVPMILDIGAKDIHASGQGKEQIKVIETCCCIACTYDHEHNRFCDKPQSVSIEIPVIPCL